MTVPETVPKPIGCRTGDVLGYARVSTSDLDAARQRDRLAAVGRPELARLIEQARPGDSLCVTRLDRLGRSLKEMLEAVEDLKSRGMQLVSFEEQIDTSSVTGELVFHVFGAITHFERRLISERTREGIAAALWSERPASCSLRPAALSQASSDSDSPTACDGTSLSCLVGAA